MVIFSNSGAWEPYSTCETWSISEYSNSEIQKHSHDSKWWWCWLMTFWIYGAPGLNRLNLSIFVVIILSIKLVDFHNSAVLNTIYWGKAFPNLFMSWALFSGSIIWSDRNQHCVHGNIQATVLWPSLHPGQQNEKPSAMTRDWAEVNRLLPVMTFSFSL